jgi:class 3 adenylate cyclase
LNVPLPLTSIDVIALALGPVAPALGRVSSPDGAITLLLSDVADASPAARRLGPERWARVLADHAVLVDQLVARHDGEVVKREGDGFLASFASAHAGLRVAVELQRTFADEREGEGLAVRAGLHSGFVISSTEQLLGRNVVLAARIAAAAKGAEILVSSAVKQYTETDPSFVFEPRGPHHFKGLVGEHEIFSVSWS